MDPRLLILVSLGLLSSCARSVIATSHSKSLQEAKSQASDGVRNLSEASPVQNERLSIAAVPGIASLASDSVPALKTFPGDYSHQKRFGLPDKPEKSISELPPVKTEVVKKSRSWFAAFSLIFGLLTWGMLILGHPVAFVIFGAGALILSFLALRKAKGVKFPGKWAARVGFWLIMGLIGLFITVAGTVVIILTVFSTESK